jgi:hypothetical protein
VAGLSEFSLLLEYRLLVGQLIALAPQGAGRLRPQQSGSERLRKMLWFFYVKTDHLLLVPAFSAYLNKRF